MMPVSLTEGGIPDLDAVMEVMDDGFDPIFGEAWTAPQCAGMLPLPGVWLSLAHAGEELLGFALGRVILKEAELLLLAVKKSARRRGIGQLLLERFALIAMTRGAQTLHLEVRDGNQAVKLYSNSGYVEIGRRKNYYTGRDGQLYDALTLSKSTGL